MAEIVKMPKLSDTMTEGVVAEWHKKVGDQVKSGDLLADIETDKATMEFESFQEGTLLYIGVEKGKTAPVDAILAILGKEGEDISALIGGGEKKEESETKKESPAPEPKQDEAKNGEAEKKETETAEKVETKPKEEAKPSAEKTAPVPQPPPTPSPSNSFQIPLGKQSKASPLARKMAKERNINVGFIRGTGDDGRVIKRDIENYTGASQEVVNVESFTEEPVSQMRKTIAKRLVESKFSAPHFYLTMNINMDEMVNARESINAVTQIKISYNDLIIKAVAAAIRKSPKVNVSWRGDKMRYNKHIHIGMAVAVEDGLLVPVIKFADTKTLSQIAAESKNFAQKAKDKKLQPADWEGNTFTISNLGMYGIEEFTGIINPPDACILAVGAIRECAVVKDGAIVPGNEMKVTLSCDHRAVDGATGSAFLQIFKFFMENPVILLGLQSI
jgi:pyruvate dehydrogenase E2 component (dihydrolipoamide acetyltransferase)